MTSLADHTADKPVKLLMIGESGSGKTGALACLAKAGYNLRIADFDNGLDILAQLLKGDKEALNKVDYRTFTDEMRNVGGKIIPQGMPKAFSGFLSKLDKWGDFGKVTEWGKQDVLVVDSLTFLGMAALRYVLVTNGRAGQQPWQSDWGQAMSYLEDVLAMLYADNVKCNVIMTSHVSYLENQEVNLIRGLPTALGNKLPPKVPRFFNTVVLAKTRVAGTSVKRMLVTSSDGVIELKCPTTVARELPLETGLKTIFEAMGN